VSIAVIFIPIKLKMGYLKNYFWKNFIRFFNQIPAFAGMTDIF